MVYFTGDLHANVDAERSSIFNRIDYKDTLIVLGDFGFSWDATVEKRWYAHNYPFTTLAVLGNHENYNRVYNDYPLVDFAGGKAYRVNDCTFYARNGEIYTIEDKKYLCFGGASSVDKMYRVPYMSWWPEEIPSNEDYDRAIKSLESVNWNFDMLLTHTGSNNEINEMFTLTHKAQDPTQDMIQNILYNIYDYHGHFDYHLFGHMHQLSLKNYGDYNSICLYEQVMKVSDGSFDFLQVKGV